ncbi:restriction endonuclease subunit S [Streptomyces tanashiensis]|uniref:restriction endonuclease subunit S n=1 Tax=Streptomyces tanashiensis TaxID=67367 RepID=UPI0033F8210E
MQYLFQRSKPSAQLQLFESTTCCGSSAMPDRGHPWPEVNLREIGEISAGGTPSRDDPSLWNGAVPWLTPGDLTKNPRTVTTESAEHITKAGLNRSAAVLMPAGALLVTTRATLGARTIAGVPMATNQGFKNVIFNSTLAESRFYFHLFGRLTQEMIRRASGTTFLEISGKEFGEIVVPLPPLSEQRKIAEILDAMDQQISDSRSVLAKVKKMQAAIGDQFLPWRGNFDCPAGWNFRRLSDLVEMPICYGIIQVGPHAPDGVPVVMIRDLGSGFQGEFHRVSPVLDSSYARSRIKGGDLLLSIKGTIGKVAVTPASFTGNISRDVARLRLSGMVIPEFLEWLFRTPYGKFLLDRSVVGTTRAEVSISVLNDMEIPIPPLEEQQRIVRVEASVNAQLVAECANLDKVMLAREALAEDLLTGKVRV